MKISLTDFLINFQIYLQTLSIEHKRNVQYSSQDWPQLMPVFQICLSPDFQLKIFNKKSIQMTEEVNRESQITDSLLTERQTLSQSVEVNEVTEQPQQPKSKVRIKSIDIYRGLTMVGMIMVDNLGPVKNPPYWICHPDWHGLTAADFIFPAFLFIMGMAVPLAISEKRPVRLRNIIRIAALFLIGFALNIIARKFDFTTVRILGVLQRLSICYAALLGYHVITGYGDYIRRKIGAIIMLIVYIAYLSLYISFDGGDLPGCSKELNLTDACNIEGYIDRIILTPAHMLKNTHTDPQGFFSTIGAIIMTYLGYECSMLMSKYKETPKKLVISWLSIAVVMGALTYPMYLLTPFNKKLFTPSFILVIGSVTAACLTFFYAIVDILPAKCPKAQKHIQRITAPLLWMGLNPLVVFVVNDLLAIFLILYIHIDGKSLWTQFFNHVFGSWISNTDVSSLLFGFFFVIFWVIITGIMHKFKFYVRL